MMNTRALDGANKLWLIIAISFFPMQNHCQVDDDINTKSSGMIWLVLAHRSHTSPDADNPGDDDDSVFAMVIILMVIDDINLSGSYSLGHDDNDDDDFRLVQSWLWHSFPICVVATSPPHCAGGELDHYDCDDYDYKSGVQTCHVPWFFNYHYFLRFPFSSSSSNVSSSWKQGTGMSTNSPAISVLLRCLCLCICLLFVFFCAALTMIQVKHCEWDEHRDSCQKNCSRLLLKYPPHPGVKCPK